jgi:16S rRNA G1207 methylase RsmC
MPANAKYLREEGYQVEEADFMTVPQRQDFDRVLMNPPFSKGQDVKHVTHALGFLKPGGRLVAIMGAGVTFRQDKRTTDFRELVQSMGGTIEPLPEGSFKSSGTMVNTVIVVIDKE